MDPLEGRNIATRAMMPPWEGFVVGAVSTNMTAWEAITVIKDLDYCMTKTQAKEGRNQTRNVPRSYDFNKVSYNESQILLLLFFLHINQCRIPLMFFYHLYYRLSSL